MNDTLFGTYDIVHGYNWDKDDSTARIPFTSNYAEGKPNYVFHTDLTEVDYTPLYIEFHSPSEHTFDELHSALEMQLVSQNSSSGAISILSVLFDIDAESQFMTEYQKIDENDGNTYVLLGDLFADFNSSLSEFGFFMYEGSITHPPCTEGVNWTVLKEIFTLSEDQLEWFTEKIASNDLTYSGNNRAMQSIGSRVIRTNA